MKHLTQRTKLSFVAAFLMSATVQTVYAGDVLTGDTRLACEAILCLSSGVRPGECSPSLARYFGISHKRWSDTVRGRINFLNLCPSGTEIGMPELINAIAHGAGRCDADYLNAHNTYIHEEEVCRYFPGYSVKDGPTCKTIKRKVISSELPKYCGTYANHEWTYQLDLKYVGEPQKGGKWVQDKDYDRALQEYNEQQKQRQYIRWW